MLCSLPAAPVLRRSDVDAAKTAAVGPRCLHCIAPEPRPPQKLRCGSAAAHPELTAKQLLHGPLLPSWMAQLTPVQAACLLPLERHQQAAAAQAGQLGQAQQRLQWLCLAQQAAPLQSAVHRVLVWLSAPSQATAHSRAGPDLQQTVHVA